MQTMPPPGAVQGPAQPPLPPPAPQPPVAAKPRSPLGRLVLSLALFGVGVVALIEVAGARVPASMYFAVALTVVAAGLVAGGWYGRARWLIAVGAVLSVLLAVAAAAEGYHWAATNQLVTWQPAGIEQVQPSYSLDAGNAVLDLSRVNFTGHTTSVDVHVSAGNLKVVLPPTVDARINSTVAIGNATVLDQHWNGIGHSQHAVIDNGVDGPGGGALTLTATVNVGNLEVRR
jgi:hypothetical protein